MSLDITARIIALAKRLLGNVATIFENWHSINYLLIIRDRSLLPTKFSNYEVGELGFNKKVRFGR